MILKLPIYILFAFEPVSGKIQYFLYEIFIWSLKQGNALNHEHFLAEEIDFDLD